MVWYDVNEWLSRFSNSVTIAVHAPRRILHRMLGSSLSVFSIQFGQVREVSHDNRMAKVVRTDVNYITSPR